ncbi:hypothetical protein Micbo1qcDRAFT_453 [Microdochium bolleyi]|uniref:Uncharacterized protein n=1 Tax=Microdochium bolleyi TaxID=196109 RepID=A0A136JGS7_9PEZI|nr:hypothetical protein Micbo1qcDRAFT_453 [Microdochium bolleyi]
MVTTTTKHQLCLQGMRHRRKPLARPSSSSTRPPSSRSRTSKDLFLVTIIVFDLLIISIICALLLCERVG